MFLKKIVIVNFKSCRIIVQDFSEDKPNIYIGPNDSGKSVILESIGCILNNKKLDFESTGKITSDVSNTPIDELQFNNLFVTLNLPIFKYDPTSIYIIGFFECEESDSKEFFDENASNHLKWSRESFSGNDIVILKKYCIQQENGATFLCTKDSTDPSTTKELWKQTKTVLAGLTKQLGIEKDEIDNENGTGPFKNIEVLRAIYAKSVTELCWSEYLDYTKDLKTLFPIFRYFDAKISMDDVKSIAKDTLAEKIAPHKEKIAKEAEKISKDVSDEINKDLKELSEKLFADLDSVKSIQMGVNFNIQENISDVIVQKSSSDGDIKLDSQGDGIKKQIWLALIKWKSMQSINEGEKSKKMIWCFDEPEIHLFPKAQRNLFTDIKNISKGVVQSFVCTHSTIFIDKFDIDSIRLVSLENQYSVVSSCKDVSDIHSSLCVKNSDILFHDKFFVVEGETDMLLMPHFYKLHFGRDIKEDNIQLIHLGGKDNRKKNLEIFNQILEGFKKQDDLVNYFFDGDSAIPATDNVCVIGRYDMEDSISDEIWVKLVKESCDFDITTSDLQEIRSCLGTERDKKFHKLLSNLLASKNSPKYLPSKGQTLANELIKIIKAEHVPKEILEFFKKIK